MMKKETNFLLASVGALVLLLILTNLLIYKYMDTVPSLDNEIPFIIKGKYQSENDAKDVKDAWLFGQSDEDEESLIQKQVSGLMNTAPSYSYEMQECYSEPVSQNRK